MRTESLMSSNYRVNLLVAAGTLTEPEDGPVTAHVLGLIQCQRPVTAVLGTGAVLEPHIIQALIEDKEDSICLRPQSVGASNICQVGMNESKPMNQPSILGAQELGSRPIVTVLDARPETLVFAIFESA